MAFRDVLVSVAGAACGLAVAGQAFAACDTTRSDLIPDSRYQIAGGEVRDTATDLVWQRCSVGQSFVEGRGCAGKVARLTWDAAKAQATGEWRLPTRDELLGLVSAACRPSVNPTAFPGMDEGSLWYWTGSRYGDSTVWIISFGGSGSYGAAPTDRRPVRLVKAAK